MPASLRKGKTKNLLNASLDSALLAVEVYNKPRTAFRSEGFIALMVIAWLRLFHAHFHHTFGQKYFYKKKGRYEIIDGEKKAWELSKCITEYNKLEGENLDQAVTKNLEFFIKLRNKIEHRHIEKREIDTIIFGECQSFLYNYETLIIKLFGSEYALNESLVYSLQFSHFRTAEQVKSSKIALSKDLKEITDYVEKFRTSLDETVYNSQEYSIKLLQVPKIANTERNDLAIEFVNFNELSEEDVDLYNQVKVLVKDKKIIVEGINIGRYKPGQIIDNVNETFGHKILNQHLHRCIYTIFKIRPKGKADDPFDTNTEFCHYDESHDDYLYNNDWRDFLIHFLQSGIEIEEIKDYYKNKTILNIEDYKP